jgi:YD repeat-containing protein
LSGGTASTAPVDRVSTFTYENGVLKSSKLAGVGETTIELEQATAVGQRVKSATTTPESSAASDFIPPALPIARTYEYQSGANFLEGVTAGGKRIESVEPHRGNTAPKTTNSSIESTHAFDPHGLLTQSESHGGTDDVSKGAKARIEYFSESAAPHLRGLPHIIREGEGADELITTYEYPSATQSIATDARGVITLTDYDAWQRSVHASVTRPGDALFLEQTWRYDDAGRLAETAERKGDGFVTTRFSYDVLGRRLSTTNTGIATVGSMTTSTAYSLGTHTITTTHPGGAITTTELDELGRTKPASPSPARVRSNSSSRTTSPAIRSTPPTCSSRLRPRSMRTAVRWLRARRMAPSRQQRSTNGVAPSKTRRSPRTRRRPSLHPAISSRMPAARPRSRPRSMRV